MITEYFDETLIYEPEELQALQSAFDELKAPFLMAAQSEKAILGMLLIGAYNSSRNVREARQIAAAHWAY